MGGFTPVAPAGGDSEDLWLASSSTQLTTEQLAQELIARGAIRDEELARLLGAERYSVDVAQLEHMLINTGGVDEDVILGAKTVLTGLSPMSPTAGPVNTISESVARATGAVMLDDPAPTIAIVDPSDTNRRTLAQSIGIGVDDFALVLVTVPHMRRLLGTAYRGAEAQADPRPQVQTLWELLDETLRRQASELFLQSGYPPALRVHGNLMWMSRSPTTEAWLRAELAKIAKERGIQPDDDDSTDRFVYRFGDARFQLSVGRDESGPMLRVRVLPPEIRSPANLGLPPAAIGLTSAERGLVLISGPSRSGRSWTGLSLTQHAAGEAARHVVTIESPIVSIIANGRSVVSQRQVPDHVASHAAGVRGAVADGAEVLLVDSVDNADCAAAVVDAVRAGLLVFAVVAAPSSADAFDQFATFAAGHASRKELGGLCTGVLNQRLVRRASDSALLAVLEAVTGTEPAREALVSGDRLALTKATEGAWKSDQMRTLDMSLAALCHRKVIDRDIAEAVAHDLERFSSWVDRLSSG